MWLTTSHTLIDIESLSELIGYACTDNKLSVVLELIFQFSGNGDVVLEIVLSATAQIEEDIAVGGAFAFCCHTTYGNFLGIN